MESKLSGEFKNTPKDTSLVLCSVSDALNKEETFSAYHKVLTDNLGEEVRRDRRWMYSLQRRLELRGYSKVTNLPNEETPRGK